MKLRYWTYSLAPAWLTYWGLSHLVRPIWAVTAAVWVCTVAAFVGIVFSETRGAPAEEGGAGSVSQPAPGDDQTKRS